MTGHLRDVLRMSLTYIGDCTVKEQKLHNITRVSLILGQFWADWFWEVLPCPEHVRDRSRPGRVPNVSGDAEDAHTVRGQLCQIQQVITA